MADLAKFAEMLVNQTQQEVIDLLKILKEEYGIEAAKTQRFPPKQALQTKFKNPSFRRKTYSPTDEKLKVKDESK